jgi:hypothetical protein
MQSFKSFLLEKLYSINRDVDYIYRILLKKTIDAIQDGTWNGRYPRGIIIKSSELKTNQAKQAHAINPINIGYNSQSGNNYIPSLHKINISINPNAMMFLKLEDPINLKHSAKMVGDGRKTQFLNDFSEQNMKGSIYHELTHWIDDSLHSSSLAKLSNRGGAYPVGSKKRNKIMYQGNKSVDTTYFEVNAQVHDLKQMKRSMGDRRWDELTWKDILQLDGSFAALAHDTKQTGEYEKWKKMILKRLAREGLLGKNMSKGR